MTKIKCNKCGDIIEGDKKGTYIKCSCKTIAIDETEYYYRIIGNLEDFEVLEPENTRKMFEEEKQRRKEKENEKT